MHEIFPRTLPVRLNFYLKFNTSDSSPRRKPGSSVFEDLQVAGPRLSPGRRVIKLSANVEDFHRTVVGERWNDLQGKAIPHGGFCAIKNPMQASPLSREGW